MRIVYSTLLYLLTPFLWLRLAWHGLMRRESWHRIPERFGHMPASLNSDGIAVWLHAVSVGEFMAALPLIRRLVALHPPGAILVTTSTATGSARVRATFGNQVAHCYAPYDLPWVVRRFLERVRPRRVIVMETELWPNLFRALATRGIPLAIANARISPRSFVRYRRMREFTASVLQDCTLIATQSEPDAQRFRDLGALPGRLRVMGNLKFDFEVPAEQIRRGQELRQQLGAGRRVWVAASTHDGEEQVALEAHKLLLEHFPSALLILAPRHPQRFSGVAQQIEKCGLPYTRRSTENVSAGAPIYFADSMGELPIFLAASDTVFVGGSLTPIGGHNVLEPAALGVPVVFGPHMFNFEHARDLLLACGAARQIQSGVELAPAINALLADPAGRARMGEAGRQAVVANRGALERFMQMMD